MRILITNDDGFMREGIRTLEKSLLSHGHEVFVVAPHSEQSAKSHAFTVSGSVTMWRHDDHHYSLEGTPTDCIIYILRSGILKKKPDLVISGINHGYNLSSDIIYSGTCSAASESVMQGIPSIALSAEMDEDGHYCFSQAADYVSSNLEKLKDYATGVEAFLNLNFPPRWNGKVEKASLGVLKYEDEFIVKENGNRIVMSPSCSGRVVLEKTRDDELEADMIVTGRGSASLTLVNLHPCYDSGRMKEIRL